jgi:capsule polysaccharide export protein KpsE/RkpR
MYESKPSLDELAQRSEEFHELQSQVEAGGDEISLLNAKVAALEKELEQERAMRAQGERDLRDALEKTEK